MLRPLPLVALLTLPGPKAAAPEPEPSVFFDAAAPDARVAKPALDALEASAWKTGYTAMLVDLARFLPRPRRPFEANADETQAAADDDGLGPGAAPGFGRDAGFAGSGAGPASPAALARDRLVRLLQKKTGKRFGHDLDRWRRLVWDAPYDPHARYADFKARLYGRLDPRFAAFFAHDPKARIRLDQVDWGGVGVNGIPPLDHPKALPAAEADYLGARDVVFGVAVNGAARAYPKRILAWHELALDRLGGVELTVVYCTLCGSVVPYGSEAGGRRFTFGTSGLLYRSNKLLFDAESATLWSSTEGRPVVGPLVGAGLELTAYPVVTTTWQAWREAHPDTSVLSLDTGHVRDYSEGAAYRDYFASDRLMFAVAPLDPRLKNKAEVLGLLSPPPGTPGSERAERQALALTAERLRREPLLPLSWAGHELIVVTTPDGANRVYERGDVRFERVEAGGVRDAEGRLWRLGEDALAQGERRLPRFAARRAFWFGWYAQFPQTELLR